MRFEHLLICLTSNGTQIWTQSYVYYNIREFEVKLPIVLKKHDFYYIQNCKKIKPYKTDPWNTN